MFVQLTQTWVPSHQLFWCADSFDMVVRSGRGSSSSNEMQVEAGDGGGRGSMHRWRPRNREEVHTCHSILFWWRNYSRFNLLSLHDSRLEPFFCSWDKNFLLQHAFQHAFFWMNGIVWCNISPEKEPILKISASSWKGIVFSWALTLIFSLTLFFGTLLLSVSFPPQWWLGVYILKFLLSDVSISYYYQFLLGLASISVLISWPKIIDPLS